MNLLSSEYIEATFLISSKTYKLNYGGREWKLMKN